MENMQQTYLNLFPLDRNGIGSIQLIAQENVDSAITAWSEKAIECFGKTSLTAEEEKFFYDYIEFFSKQRHLENAKFLEFKTLYIQKLLEAITSGAPVIELTDTQKESDYASRYGYRLMHNNLDAASAVEELTIFLSMGPEFNEDRIKLRFDDVDTGRGEPCRFSARDNELVVDHKLASRGLDGTMESALNRIYAILCLVEHRNLENEMNHDLTLNALMYTIEKNYKRAFKSKAFDLMIETPMLDYHAKDNTCDYLARSYIVDPTLPHQEVISTFVSDRKEWISRDNHYTPKMTKTYGSDPIESMEAMTTEITTRSLISLRANPKSMPTEVKRLLFIDGELKTFYQLKKELGDLESTKFAMTTEAYEEQKSEKERMLDYLTTYCIPLKIERIVNMISESNCEPNNEYVASLYSELEQLRAQYPNEYETAISILKNRLNKLNAYCASSTKVTSYLDEIMATRKDLDVIQTLYVEPTARETGMVDVSVDLTKTSTLPSLSKLIYELQKLTGKGVDDIVTSLQLTCETQLPLLHNVPAELAKAYTSSKSIKKSVKITK